MQGRRPYAWLILLPVTIVAVLCAALPGLPLPVRAIGAAPLVLYLPGYWLLAAVAPEICRGPLERAAFSAGISIAVCALVGLLLNLTAAGLTRDAWVLTLGGIALAGSAAAWLRNRHRAAEPWPALFPSPGRRGGAMFALAGLVLIGAFGLIHFTAEQQTAPDVTQFWITPAEPNGGAAQLGVRNLEPGAVTYIVELRANGELVRRWAALTVPSQQSWQTELTAPDGTPLPRPLEALLFRADHPGEVYRRVLLRDEGAARSTAGP